MKYAAAIFLLGTVCAAEEAKKPACNAAHQGRFWPEEANASAVAARRLYQRGELKMCVQAVWKHEWQRLSVNVRNLSKTRPESAAGSRSAEPRP
jgi:hypothetical protein